MSEFALYEYAAEVVYVVDGDTVDLIVDLGFRVRVTDRFRLRGVDTPERGQPGYLGARAYVEALLGVGSMVMIRTHLDQTDKYGRMLAQVFYKDAKGDYVDINADLISRGLGKPYMV